ncbi:hypothetical protein GBF38_001725 [Nibea albiflora]|uniref:Uncharacterized protein n=1 Tax=Nibea albiflora TaxID=240163 RepID=A0ACB7EUD3_NIBAL|nr:hypothetical protein GBF38_001725 [Nibea albiflora]
MIEELEKENDGLAQKLTKTTNQLASSRNEYLQSHKAWQEECTALQEKSREELAAKEQSWKTKVQQLEEEKKELVKNVQTTETALKQVEEEKKNLVTKAETAKMTLKEMEDKKNVLENIYLSHSDPDSRLSESLTKQIWIVQVL